MNSPDAPASEQSLHYASAPTDVPVIDVGAYLATGAPGDLPERIDAVCTSTGFFQVRGHGIEASMFDAVYESAERTWRLSAEELESYASPTGHPFRGVKIWTGEDGSVKKYSLQNNLYEDAAHALAAGVPEAYAEWFEPNVWPRGIPGLIETRAACFDACRSLGGAIMRLFSLALGMESDGLDRYFSRDSSYFSVMDYPAGTAWNGATRTAEHSDSGILTMLHQRGNYEGLELQPADGGSWIPVPVIDDAIVINIGDLMARWTNDRWRATRHRVVGAHREAHRSSIAAFYMPNVDAVIEPLPSCLEGEGPRYEAITPYEWEAQFFEKRYGARRPDPSLTSARG